MDILEEKISSDYLLKYVALHRMMVLMYQHCHWITRGTVYYADHLLFQRLYEKVSDEIDTIAEKSVGLSSEKAVCPVHTTEMACKLMKSMFPNFDVSKDPHSIVEDLLVMEISFLEQNEAFYKKLEDEDQMTLGMDDLIMTLHSSHEENVYLLKQRFKAQDISLKEYSFNQSEGEVEEDDDNEE